LVFMGRISWRTQNRIFVSATSLPGRTRLCRATC
jgi:hypothetical protein